MPRSDQIQGGVSRSQTPDIKDPGQAPAGHEHIAGNKVTVAHHVPAPAVRQFPEDVPHPAKPRNVHELAAAGETGLHPGVMGGQVASPA